MTSSSSSLLAVISILFGLASMISLTESFSATVSLNQRRIINFNLYSPPSSSSSSSSLYAISNPLRRRSSATASSDGDSTKNKRQAKQQHNNLIQQITSITDYKNLVVEEQKNITVVRFYSHYCRSCRASEPHFFKLAQDFQRHNVNFVEVPLQPATKILHEALGVPSLPWTHIYHPEAGLVEERKVSKKFIGEVRSGKSLKKYCSFSRSSLKHTLTILFSFEMLCVW